MLYVLQGIVYKYIKLYNTHLYNVMLKRFTIKGRGRNTTPEPQVTTEAEFRQWLSQRSTPQDTVDPPFSKNLMPAYDFHAIVHDAWRSTYDVPSTDDPLVGAEYRKMPVVPQAFCWVTGGAVLRAIYAHAQGEWRRGRTFDNGFVYHAMLKVFKGYAQAKTGLDDSNEAFTQILDEVSTMDGLTNLYNQQPPDFREKDRRIVVASMTTLEDPEYKIWGSLPHRAAILDDPYVQQAIEDGHNILNAVRSAVPYRQEQGYASEVVQWMA